MTGGKDNNMKCCICGNEFQSGEWGNNPYPVKEDGECCSVCNDMFVVPAMIKGMNHEEAEAWADSMLRSEEDGSGTKDEISVIIKKPGEKYGHTAVISNTLEAFQNLVGGYIETVSCGGSAVLIVNEEGKLNGLPLNFRLGHLDIIAGTAVLVGVDGDGFTDTPYSFSTWKRLLSQWGN